MATEYEKLREKVARAIYERRNGHGCMAWSIRAKSHREPYLDDADATMSTIYEALREPSGGMPTSVVVLRERPDLGENISESFPVRTREVWPLLLSASPLNGGRDE